MPLTVTQQLLGLDRFPVMGWCSIPEELTRPDVFAAIRDCGINLIMTTGAGGGATGPTGTAVPIRRQLDLAAEHGLKAIVCDRRFNPVKNPANDDWKRAVDTALAEYRAHPAAAGFYVFDEPVVSDPSSRCGCEDVGPMVAYLTQQAPDKLAYVNALGFGSRGANSFPEYLDRYLSLINPQFLSTDCYPLTSLPDENIFPGYVDDDAGLRIVELDAYYREAYWEGWEIQARAARTWKKPLWGFVMAIPHTHSRWFYGPVTEGTIRLEAFTALAYGAEAIQYFALPTHTTNSYYEDGILDADGRPSLRYELFRRVNRDLAILGPLVAELQMQDVYYRGYIPSGGKRFRFGRYAGDESHRPLAHLDNEDNLLLSFMDGKDGARYLFVVNNHPARRTRVRLSLETGWTFREVIKHTGAFTDNLSGTHLANFEPGDARLFRMIHDGESILERALGEASS